MNTITQIIYIDILLCLNLFINYFILLATSKYLKLVSSKARTLFGASFGALCSLIILLPPMPFYVSCFTKLIIALLIVIITYGYKGLKQLLKSTGAFFLISFCYCGAMIALWLVFTPNGMVVKNEIVYFNISPLIMVISTLVCYIVLRIISRLSGREEPKKIICKLRIVNIGNTVEISGRIDTGNSLTEPFSGSPVIVADECEIKKIIPEFLTSQILSSSKIDSKYKEAKDFRVIPFSSVGGTGTMPAFKPQLLFIDNVLCTKEVYIAVCKSGVLNGCYKAMVNYRVLN